MSGQPEPNEPSGLRPARRRCKGLTLVMLALVGAGLSGAPAASAATAFTVTATATPSPATEGATYTVSGSVSPAAAGAGAGVKLQQFVSGAWHTLASATLSSSSTYSFTRTAPDDPAILQLRVHKPASSTVAAGNGSTTEAITSTTLTSGQSLTAGEYLISPNSGQYELVMQGDGNLVEYVRSSMRALWSTGTGGNPGAYAIMQTDGNLVVYLGSTALWNTHTGGNTGAYVSLADDANLIVESATANPLWSNAVINSTLASGETLVTGQRVYSSNDAQYVLLMQGDGNLVEYVLSSMRALWSTGTGGHPGAYAVMQTDGNLVVYSATGTALWNSHTGGQPGLALHVQDDANLVIYPFAGGAVAWASYGVNPYLEPSEKLSPGDRIYAQGEKDVLIMQGDGNFVEYTFPGMTPIWASNTAGHAGAFAIMQTDGNLVVYSPTGPALWNSQTGGNAGAHLVVESTSALAIISTNGTVLWSTGSVGTLTPVSSQPSWWSGACDSNLDTKSKFAAIGTWTAIGLVACAPTVGSQPDTCEQAPMSCALLFECVELSARWLYQEWGIPLPGGVTSNGNTLVGHYWAWISTWNSQHPSQAKPLTRVTPTTSGPGLVGPGDVISFNGGTNGHTAVVTSVSGLNSSGTGTITTLDENWGLTAPYQGVVKINVTNWVIKNPVGSADLANSWLHFTG